MALARRRNKLGRFVRRAAFLGALAAIAVPARADWRADTGTFRVGIAVEDGDFATLRRTEAFRALVAETLSMPVEIYPARDASALIDAMATSRVEYAVFSALGYATAFELCECVEPLAAPVGRDGATALRSVLLADKARVARIADLADVTVAIGPEDGLGGDLLPATGFLWQGGPLAGSGLDLVSVKTTRESLRRLADGEVAAAFLWEFVRPGSPAVFTGGPRAWLDEVAPDGYAVLWRSEAIRFGPHAVRRNLPAEVKASLRHMLVGLVRTDPEIYESVSKELAGGFEAAAHDEYRSAIALIEALGAAPR